MTFEQQEACEALNDTARLISEAAQNPADSDAIGRAQAALSSAKGILKGFATAAQEKQAERKENLAQDRARLLDILDRHEQATQQFDHAERIKAERELGEMLGLNTFVSLAVPLCEWILSEAKKGRHYQDFQRMMTELWSEEKMLISYRRSRLNLTRGELTCVEGFAHNVKSRILEVTGR